jgi:hypothetical protein
MHFKPKTLLKTTATTFSNTPNLPLPNIPMVLKIPRPP